MSKIFLAISKPETLVTVLKQKFPESEISVLESIEQVTESIKAPFQLLICSHTLFDSELLNDEDFSGQIIIYDPQGELVSKQTHRVHIYKTIENVKTHIITKKLENDSIIKSPKLQDKSKKKSEDSTAETNNEEMKVSPSKNKTDSDTKVKEEAANKRADEKDTGNSSKPTQLDNFPPNEEEIKQVVLNPRYQKALSIRKAAVPGRNKTIGVWSPISTGITTFVVNFAIYLSHFDIDVAVVELPSERQKMKRMLTRFQSLPTKWSSFIENYLSDDLPAEDVNWLYKGVNWFPLGDEDNKYTWNSEILTELLHTAKQYKLVFIDYPSGNMDKSALNSLSHLDELWILIDDNFDEAYQWKKEIHKIIHEYKFNSKLIFNMETPNKSRKDEIAELLELQLIGCIPMLPEIFRLNTYESKPSIELHSRSLTPIYHEIAEYLLGVDKVQRKPLNIIERLKKFVRT
jgi:hypothetical protein